MTNCVIHSEKDGVFLFALFSAHLFKEIHILMTQESIPGRGEDLWQQLESVQSAKQTAPQLKNNCTRHSHTQPYSTIVNPAVPGG